MKGKQLLALVNILEVVFLTSIPFTQTESSHPHSVTGPKLVDASPFLHKSMAKRQTDRENEQFCDLKREELACTSGFYQAFVDALLNCGHLDHARELAFNCAQNNKGEYCTAVYYKLTHADSDLSTTDTYCSGVARSDSCPLNCRKQLQLLKEKLGCCPVSYLMGYYMLAHQSSTRYESYDSVFDYQVWNQCGVSLPTPCVTEIPSLSEVDRDCTEEEFHHYLYTQALCVRGGAGQAFISGLLSIEERCTFSATFLIDNCAFNARGEDCELLDVRGTLRNIDAQCSRNSLNGSSCTQACAGSITQSKNSIGCCVNLYNNSDANSYYGTRYRDALSYALWQSCGVESPGVCESTLSLSGSKSVVREISIWITTFAALMVLIQ